jgi:plasmid replication initiation protein
MNSVIEGRHDLTTNENRIILCAIAQINKGQKITDEVMYRIRVKDLAELAGSKSSNFHAQLDEAAVRLFNREIRLSVHDEKTGKERKKLRRWVQSAEYVPLSGEVEVRFSKDIIPCLTEITSEYTIFQLAEILKLKSQYSFRIYELLMQWKNTGYRKVEINWLRDTLCIDEKYPSIKDFKKHVLDKAVDEINKNTTLRVNYTQDMKGRKITHFTFNFSFKAKEAKPMDKKPVQAQKTNKNVTYKNTGESEHMGKYHPFSKAEIMLANKDYPALTEMQVRDKLLAERKAAS